MPAQEARRVKNLQTVSTTTESLVAGGAADSGVASGVASTHGVFEQLESEVRSYSRAWPVIFDWARGARLQDTDGNTYIDFFSGAGALNYGHNHPVLKRALLDYLAEDRVIHSLDMNTVAKAELLERLREVVFEPRGLSYRVQFPGPTGTNAVEAALKLARKVTGRKQIVSFTNAFHGMTLGSLSVTANSMKRSGAGVSLNDSTHLPYCSFLDDDFDSIHILEALIEDSGSGLDLPAAVIVETVQGEGGVNVASVPWLQRLAGLCAAREILLIVDDVQMGCGRTGPFFSFEDAGIVPDIVVLSKSLSGIGLPLALTLIRPELDVWEPGEHNGTFRGNNPAFVTATAALSMWQEGGCPEGRVAEVNQDGHAPAEGGIEGMVRARGRIVEQALVTIADELRSERPDLEVDLRGKGLVWGLALPGDDIATKAARAAFDRGVLVETSGPNQDVVKLMPPLTVSVDDELMPGLEILAEAIRTVVRL
ncbi:MAG TPA: diaminobutyrate--2-oxoglutarate transaminase [Acidimicrobiales bacterium]|jgi:diaminobutyrate-2-oxoglutarate transaminase